MTRAALRQERTIEPIPLSKSSTSFEKVFGAVQSVPTANMPYGFVNVRRIATDAFVWQRIIKESGMRDKFVVGAIVRCDIEYRKDYKNHRHSGWRITRIHEITPPPP